jgi:HPt (histidine-containing phosphotransfer) domain-containing protein
MEPKKAQFNLEALHNLTSGNPELLREMLQTVYDQFAYFEEALGVALANEDLKEVSRLAHSLKSNARLLQMTTVIPDAVYLSQFEEQQISTDFASVVPRVERLIHTVHEVTAALQERLEGS